MQPQPRTDWARVGPYDVLDELPPGSTGRAFLVADGPSPRPEYVAKILDAPRLLNPKFLAMLEAERPGALAYRHTFAAQIRTVDVQPTRVTIVTDMIDGMPLGALLARVRSLGEALPWEVVVNFGFQAAWALQAAHARPWRADSSEGLYHGRLGPEALYITYDGYARVLGVGLGRSRRCLPPRLSSLPYLAPELTGERRLAPQADVFALGLTLYDALRGKRTFERETVEATRQAVATEPLMPLIALRDDIPREVDDLLQEMTRKVPSERPSSLAEVSQRLRACLPDDDTPFPAMLATTMRDHFGDRADLPRRERCRLRRRLGVSSPDHTSWIPPHPPPSEDDEQLSDLIDRFVPSRRISEEPAGTPAEPQPAPPRTPPPRTSSSPRTPSSPMDAVRPREPSGAHRTITATVFAEEVRRAQRKRQADTSAALPPFPPPAEPLAAPEPPPPPPPVLSPAEMDAEAGTLIGDRYRIIDVLGQGAAAIVYRAEHVSLSKSFAVKVLRPELSLFPYIVERFKREAQAVSKLDHPNIVWVSDFGQTETGAMFLVMPLVAGVTLQRVLQEHGPVDVRFAIEVALGVLAGLGHAHGHGLVHRDLKPENMMLDVARPNGVRILDFGIAKVAGGTGAQRITQTGMIPGTPAYMAPEQAAGETVDGRSDLYALGVTLYEMLSGRLPFVGDSLVDLLSRVMTDPPAPFTIAPHPEVDTRQLERVVAVAMAKRIEERFENADVFAAALRACLRA